jgi:hypothetical protein
VTPIQAIARSILPEDTSDKADLAFLQASAGVCRLLREIVNEYRQTQLSWRGGGGIRDAPA